MPGPHASHRPRRYSTQRSGNHSPTTSGPSSLPSCSAPPAPADPCATRAAGSTPSAGSPPSPAAPCRILPLSFGKPDTASRQFRRWAKAGLCTRLLEALADPDHSGGTVLRRLESWICRSYRRAWGLLGVPGVALAQRLGFLSALRAPSMFLPDPDLSEYVQRCLHPVLDRIGAGGLRAARLPHPDFLKACAWLFGAAGGRRRIPRSWAPP